MIEKYFINKHRNKNSILTASMFTAKEQKQNKNKTDKLYTVFRSFFVMLFERVNSYRVIFAWFPTW